MDKDSICVNGNAAFSITAATTDAGTLTYQWQESSNGTTFNNIANTGIFAGATSSNLALTTVPNSKDNFFYRVIVTETVGTIACPDTSNAANLQVFAKPTLSTVDKDSICVNGDAAFSICLLYTSPSPRDS